LPQPDKSILIAGGGIAGLSTALALARLGISSHVFEKSAVPAEEGAGIQIGPNGTRILRWLGLFDALQPFVSAPPAICVRNGRTGGILTRLPLGEWIAGRHAAPYWTLHRHDLHAVLLAAVKSTSAITVSAGIAVSDANSKTDRAAAILQDGTEVEGAALVAADGRRSILRGAHFRTSTPVYAGKIAYRSLIATDARKIDDVNIWIGPGCHALFYPVRQGRELAAVAILEEAEDCADASSSASVADMMVRLAGHAPDLLELFARAPDWRRWPLLDIELPSRLSDNRLALVGDAAHPIQPFLAQGAVLALEDAQVLANVIADAKGNFADALARYSALRLPRIRRIRAASAANGKIYHMSGPLAGARNAILGGVPPALLMRRYDWIYGWRLAD